MILLSTQVCDQSSDLWQRLEIAAELESDLQDTVNWGRKCLVDSSPGKICLIRLIALVVLMWKWMGMFLRKNHLLRCWGCLSLLNWTGLLHYLYCLNSIQKNWGLDSLFEFLSTEVALYLYRSTIRPCMEQCCHAWAGDPGCYLEMLDKLQKRICWFFTCYLSWTFDSSPKCSQLKSFL